eukprot:6881127-Pyramimonas_sp.AAC.1
MGLHSQNSGVDVCVVSVHRQLERLGLPANAQEANHWWSPQAHHDGQAGASGIHGNFLRAVLEGGGVPSDRRDDGRRR